MDEFRFSELEFSDTQHRDSGRFGHVVACWTINNDSTIGNQLPSLFFIPYSLPSDAAQYAQ